MKHDWKLIGTVFLLTAFCSQSGFSQINEDYIGAGHDEGIVVTTSDNHQYFSWAETASGNNTVNGQGLDARLLETSRFLSQATLGADKELIYEVANLNFADWIDGQFEVPSTSILAETEHVLDLRYQMWIDEGNDPEGFFGPSEREFMYAWWQVNLTNEDMLRQRVALALSEICVASSNSDLGSRGYGLASYYDIFVNNAFGNYKDILNEVSLHPSMGYYLSHLNNPKADEENNIHPDENYAREVMQLFSIGLYELNIDGSHILDEFDNEIPSYGINDIKEMAKIFTGLGPGAIREEYEDIYDPTFGYGMWVIDLRVPMAMYEDWHESGAKYLLNNYTVPSGQTGLEDIEDAVENLFNHQNVGPFISRRLIQNLVKSNPTPAYIQRVAEVFNNNGNGVRGDMKAVVKAILLDEEARECSWIQNPEHGKLREPMMRYFNYCRAMNIYNEDDLYWNIGYDFHEGTGQLPMGSPSVFNFFLPDYQPIGAMASDDLFGPEFQIHNSLTSLNYINHVDDWVLSNYVIYNWEASLQNTFVDFGELESLAKDPEVLINRLDMLFTAGQLTDETREIIRESITGMDSSEFWSYYLEYRTYMAIYLILISPDYAILK